MIGLGRAVWLAGSSAALLLFAACAENPPTPPPTRPPVALGPVEVTSAGDVAPGGVSSATLVFRFTETTATGIARGEGSFQVILTDQAGQSGTLGFTGGPQVEAPGSLGATATLTEANVLTIRIEDSDTTNVEQMTITGLAIYMAPSAAPGAINAAIGGCTGSLAGCTATTALASPGRVVAAP